MPSINEDNIHIAIKKTEKVLQAAQALGTSVSAMTDLLYESIISIEEVIDVKIKLRMPDKKIKIIKKRIIRRTGNFVTDID